MRYCKMRGAGGLGESEIPDRVWNMQTTLPAGRHFLTDRHQAEWCLEQLLTQHRFPRKISGQRLAKLTTKTANSGLHSRNPYRNTITCYDTLSIATPGVYWAYTVSYSKSNEKHKFSHTCNVSTSVNKNFCFPLKWYSVSYNVRCFWLTLYIMWEKYWIFIWCKWQAYT
jgi:hypothetical protein